MKRSFGATMKKQIRVVSAFILITFLFSIFVIPTNINARVDVRFTQEVNFGEPGSERGWTTDLPPNDVTSINETSEAESGSQSKSINIWYIYFEIIFSQVFFFLY